MQLTTKTAKELQKLKSMFKDKHSNFSNGIIQDNINQIINFKNEMKENINIVDTPDGKFDINCRCVFCNWVTNLIKEIESVENE